LTAGVGAGYGAGDCSVCNWTNTEDYEPGKEYRVKVFVDDTPGDGPVGDAGAQGCLSVNKGLDVVVADEYLEADAVLSGQGVLVFVERLAVRTSKPAEVGRR